MNEVIPTSDERFKTNIKPLSQGLEAVLKLKPISYNWKSTASKLGKLVLTMGFRHKI
ncbi:tail fiber domain-containing protein [Soonwooa purpurea]